MSEYISKDALLEKLKYLADFNMDIDYVTKEDIMSIPSVDLKEKGRLKMIRDFIVRYIMRDDQVMYSDDARDVGPHHIDLIYVIASLYEELHKEVTGEPYEYMFHWANKVGSWVEDDLFSEEKFKQFLEELQNEHINN